jgi:hypothetical protein
MSKRVKPVASVIDPSVSYGTTKPKINSLAWASVPVDIDNDCPALTQP